MCKKPRVDRDEILQEKKKVRKGRNDNNNFTLKM